MAQSRSFKEYVKNKLDTPLWNALENYLQDAELTELGLRSCRVRNIGGAELDEIEVKFVDVFDLPGSCIAFDVVLDATIIIRDNDIYHNDETDSVNQWFMLCCKGDLSCSLEDMTVNKIEVYNCRNRDTAKMSDTLVPMIHHNELDKIAEDFLKRNGYEEALKTPMPIEPHILAAKMGLTIEMRQISKDFSVFGEIFFYDTSAQIYDEVNDSMKSCSVKAGTIFVDPQNFFMRNLGSVNNTIIHECVHWDKHRKAFELERLYNKEAAQIQCSVVGGIKESKARSATDWMEWQANALTPRIQMPLVPFKIKASEVIHKYRKELGIYEIVDILEPVINELSYFYCVSRCAAKIRMVDAGYDEAIGVFTYIDDRYVKPHRFRKGAIRKNQTYSISLKDALIESAFSEKLSEKLKSGNYIFIDSHFCLNHPKYVRKDEEGKASLTEYARLHIDECCLIFDLKVKSNNKYAEQFFTECVLFRDAESNIVFEAHYSDDNKDNPNQEKMMKDFNAEMYALMSTLPASFSGTLDALIKWSDMKEEDLAWDALISEKTIQRLRNHEPDNVSIETVIQLCIAMKLPPILSNNLIQKSGKRLMMTEQHIAYQFLIDAFSGTKTVEECNEILKNQNLKPLTTKTH